jgi:hypothetical protein
MPPLRTFSASVAFLKSVYKAMNHGLEPKKYLTLIRFSCGNDIAIEVYRSRRQGEDIYS